MAVPGDQSVDEKWQRARLFPVTGIGNPNEQERRGTSVLLAVLSAVKEFGRALTVRCGASTGKIETFIEVPFELNGSHCRPDGLIRVTRGQKAWTALVEVKTGRNDLDPDQVTTYLDVARDHDYDAVVTISHQVATTPGVHPVAVDKRKTRKVDLIHLSWSRIHTEAKIQHANHEVSDPDQAWLLTEFIRYIEDPKAGALDFEDMGPSWPGVRDGARQQTLRANDAETLAVVTRFDQLIAFCGMELSRRLGVHVSQRLSRSELEDQANRVGAQAAELAKGGQLSGALLVPNAAVPVEITVDLRANRVDVKTIIPAPTDRRAQARVSWLLNQLKAAPVTLQVVANVARMKSSSRSCALASLAQDPKAIVDQPGADIRSFTVTLSEAAGTKRGQGKGSFVSSVTSLVDQFYTEVVQPLKPWAPPAPKPKAAPVDPDRAEGPAGLAALDRPVLAPFATVSVVDSPDGGGPIEVGGLPAPASS
jgi:hypothetical protein